MKRRASRRRDACGLAICLVVVVSLASGARAQSAEGWLRTAQHAERRADPAAAAAAYAKVLQGSPGSRLARNAARRLRWLEARADDGYRTLAAIERLRRRSGELSAEAVDRLDRELADAPPSLAKREGLALVGEANLTLGRCEPAFVAFEALGAQADSEAGDRRTAASGAARAELCAGSPGEAVSRLESAGLGDGALAQRARSELRRWWGSRVAWLILVAAIMLSLALGGRRLLDVHVLRRALSRRRLLVGACTVGVPFVIAALFDAATVDTFARLALGSALVMTVASWVGTALGPDARRPRRWLMAAVILAELAVAYLVLVSSGAVLSFAA